MLLKPLTVRLRALRTHVRTDGMTREVCMVLGEPNSIVMRKLRTESCAEVSEIDRSPWLARELSHLHRQTVNLTGAATRRVICGDRAARQEKGAGQADEATPGDCHLRCSLA